MIPFLSAIGTSNLKSGVLSKPKKIDYLRKFKCFY